MCVRKAREKYNTVEVGIVGRCNAQHYDGSTMLPPHLKAANGLVCVLAWGVCIAATHLLIAVPACCCAVFAGPREDVQE